MKSLKKERLASYVDKNDYSIDEVIILTNADILLSKIDNHNIRLFCKSLDEYFLGFNNLINILSEKTNLEASFLNSIYKDIRQTYSERHSTLIMYLALSENNTFPFFSKLIEIIKTNNNLDFNIHISELIAGLAINEIIEGKALSSYRLLNTALAIDGLKRYEEIGKLLVLSKEVSKRLKKRNIGLEKGRDHSIESRINAAEEKENKYKEYMFRVWPNNPKMTVKEMAEEIKMNVDTNDAVSTIRRKIKGYKKIILSQSNL